MKHYNNHWYKLKRNTELLKLAHGTSPMLKATLKFKSHIDIIQKSIRLWHNVIITIETFEQILSELNYPPIPDMNGHHMKLLIRELNALEDGEEKVELLDEYIVLRFDDTTLDYYVDLWKEYQWLGKRVDIINQIVKAHKQELYYLSVLAVFPQIEGILAEIFPEKRNEKGDFTTKHLRQTFSEILDVSDSLDQQWDNFYKENLLRGFQHNEPIEYLSRHALAHGANFEYGTKVNSTKSLIILGYILSKIDKFISDKQLTHPI